MEITCRKFESYERIRYIFTEVRFNDIILENSRDKILEKTNLKLEHQLAAKSTFIKQVKYFLTSKYRITGPLWG